MAMSAYGKALASMAKESVIGSVKGFASDVKSAAISEMPALSGAVAFARSLRREADKSNEGVKEEVKKQVKEQKFGNVIGLESAKLLKTINANTSIQTRLMIQQNKYERQNRIFAEEEQREKLIREKKLIDAIKNVGGKGGATSGSGQGLLGDLSSSALTFAALRALILPKVLGALGLAGIVASGSLRPGFGGRTPRILESIDKVFRPTGTGGTSSMSAAPAASAGAGATRPPVSIRNNNPGNLRFANQPGATRGELGFARFNSPEAGIEALRRQVYLDTQGRGLTLSQFINKYAPPNENNTSRYVSYVSQQTGIKPNEVVPENMIPAVMRAIVRMEGGQGAYSYFYEGATGGGGGAGGGRSGGGGDDSGFGGPKVAPNYRSDVLAALGISYPTSSVGSGTIAPSDAVIPTRDDVLIALATEQNEKLDNIRTSSGEVQKIETQRFRAERLRATRRVETPEERLLRTANERFLSGFQTLTTRKITSAIEQALFPGGYGVTAAETRGELYRGNVAANLLGTQRFFDRTFGREYGPLFDQLSRSYLEVGARATGQFLFGGTEGVDSQALTGQILGNIAGGRKDVALEQLLYGMTGTSSGVETLFAKYGFGSAREGVGQMGNVLGAATTDVVRNTFPFMGEVPGRDKVEQEKLKAAAIETRDSSTVTSEAVTQQNKLTEEYGKEHSNLQKETQKVTEQGANANVGATVAAAQATGNVFTRGIEWLGGIFQSSAGKGSGTSIGGSAFGTGTFGNFLVDLGKTVAIEKMTSGIKNPYAKVIANFGLNRAADIGIETLMSGGNFASFGSNLASAFFGPNTALTSAYGATLGQQLGSQALGSIGLAGTAAAYSSMVPGLTFGSQQAAMLAAQTGGFGAAGLSATAAAGSTATAASTAAAGSTFGSTMVALASNPITWVVLGAALLMGRKKKPAAVYIHRALAIIGNSNIDAKFTISQHNPPEGYQQVADQILNVAFNLTKSLEVRVNKMSPFAVVHVNIHQNHIEVALDDAEGKLLEKKKWGAPHTVSIPTVVKEAMTFIGDVFKKHTAAEEEQINKGVSDLMRKSYRELTSGIEASVSRELELAPSAAGDPGHHMSLQAQAMMREFKRPELQGTSDPEGGFTPTGDRLIYDFRTGKMVSQTDSGLGVTRTTERRYDSNVGGMVSVPVTKLDERIIGIDSSGNAMYNVGASRIDAEDMVAALQANPSLMASITPAPGTIAPPPPVSDTTDYRSMALGALGGVNTVVNTNNQSSNVTNISGHSSSDADPFRRGESISAA